jgi:hypothetical protein
LKWCWLVLDFKINAWILTLGSCVEVELCFSPSRCGARLRWCWLARDFKSMLEFLPLDGAMEVVDLQTSVRLDTVGGHN